MERIDAEYKWGEANKTKDLRIYSDISNELNRLPQFLYAYAFELYKHNEYDESLSVALRSSKALSNYDLELLLGDIYLKKNEFALAEKHYKKAASMIPCRFIPLQALRDVYIASGDTLKDRDVSHEILNKPVKISSLTVSYIKNEAKKSIE